jgi:GH15 family glucan-1,4-alpha-glucosidase
MSSCIEDYALIGDLETAALVCKNGSIDWLCWPRFDSPACFAALLGTPEHGRWQISPTAQIKSIRRRYRPHTLILETEFETDQGAFVLLDFMPPRERHSHLVRLVRGLRGKVDVRLELVLRFDYGSSVPWVTTLNHNLLRAIAGPNMTALRTPVKLHGEGLKTVAQFTVRAGQSIPFVLTYTASQGGIPRALDEQKSLASTEKFWRKWTAQGSYRGKYQEAVERSLITLKALTYWPTGGMIAAPTTSLPECLGGTRNWDYRYCWLRDSSFTLWALTSAGYREEAIKWRDWLVRAVAGSPEQVQIMYGLAGERALWEWEVSWLPGYENSKPVRIGNAASLQLQLDMYGEIAGVMHHARHGKFHKGEPAVELQTALLDHLEKIWREPDSGIWEMRGPRRHFVHSKMMAWVAFDRAVKSAEEFGMRGPVDKWRAIRDEIHQDVCNKGFHPGLNSFVQYYGAKHLDASLLLMPIAGFLPPSDPRIVGTVNAIEKALLHEGLVLRYHTHKTDDGLPPGEGVFLACSFWLAHCYLLLGRRAHAEKMFDRLLKLRNDVGLLAEEYEPAAKRQVGNFPQAFSHIALVNTALHLEGRNEEEGRHEAARKKKR